MTGPEIVTRGWVYAPEAEDLLEDAKQVGPRRRSHGAIARRRDSTSTRCGATPAVARQVHRRADAAPADRDPGRHGSLSTDARGTRDQLRGPPRARDRRRQRRRRRDRPRARATPARSCGSTTSTRSAPPRSPTELGGAATRASGEGRRHQPAQDPAHARGDGPGRHPREQRGHPDLGLRELKQFVDTSPEDWEGDMRLNLGAVLHVTHAYVGAMVDARVGEDRHDRLRRGPQGRAHAGDLRRGEGRGDGIHPRARGRGRAARRDRQLRRARHDEDRASSRRRSSSNPELEHKLGPALPGAPASATRATRPLLVALLCSDAAAGSPARCTRSTAATPRRSVAAPGRPCVPATDVWSGTHRDPGGQWGWC